MDGLSRGNFRLSFGWSGDGPTPYDLYAGLLGSAALRPVGEPAASQWHRLADPESDVLLTAFEQATDPGEQRRLAAGLQRRFATLAPAIPLFPSPSWGQANTTRIEGFPSAADPYALLSPHASPESLLVLRRLRARPPAGDGT
jgi:peptide/nickel transport system substrate-binding protein